MATATTARRAAFTTRTAQKLERAERILDELELWAWSWEDPSGLRDPLHAGERQGIVRAKLAALTIMGRRRT